MKILVPLDGSECSETAIPWAKLLAEGQGADVHLVRSYVPFENLHLVPQLPITVAELVNDEGEDNEINAYLDQKAKEFGDLKVTTECVKGHAGDCILESSHDADLIVMASHGTSGVTRWLLGSVATKVVRGSETPVLVVNAREEEATPPVKLERIMVALDESERAEVALEEAARLARVFKSTLIMYEGIVNVWKTSGPDTWASERAAEYMTGKVESLSDIEVETEIYRSSVGPEIVEQAEELKADLVVMCSHGRSGLSRWVLGSVTESVVQRATCPVLVFYNRPS
jgi:nucleotide-binding universal stress UspA family protein